MMLEIQNVADVCPTELINRLVIVADHAQIPMRSRQKLDKRKLRRVRILILIHHDIAEPALINVEHLRVQPEQLDSLHQQVVEIHRVVASQPRLVFGVGAGNQKHIRTGARCRRIAFRRDQFIFR